MFTLKLYRRHGGQLRTKIVSVQHVERLEIGPNTDEIRAFNSDRGYDYQSWYVGERKPEMTALDDDNHWEWGLLENAAGKFCEHFRPHTYG